MVQRLWKTIQQFLKKLSRVTMWPSNSTPRYILKKMKTYVHTKTYMNVHSSIIHNCQKREQRKCPSSDEWTKCGRIIQWNIFSHEKEWSSALASVAQLAGASSYKPKGCRLDSHLGHVSRLWVQGMCGSNPLMFLSLRFSLSLKSVSMFLGGDKKNSDGDKVM